MMPEASSHFFLNNVKRPIRLLPHKPHRSNHHHSKQRYKKHILKHGRTTLISANGKKSLKVH